MRFLSECKQLNQGIRIIITIVLGIALVTGVWRADAYAASANAPVPKSVIYRGKGKVQVIFLESVKYRKPKVTVKDSDGEKYKARILKKGSDSITFLVTGCEKNREFTFRIKGIKVRGFKRFTTVDSSFRSDEPEKPVVESVEYDTKSRTVEFEFRDDVEWKDPVVTIKRGSRKYHKRILDTDDDGLEVKVKKLKYGKAYKYSISGVRVAGTEEYITVKGTFKALAG